MKIEPSEEVFRAVSDPTRRALLDQLRNGESEAGELLSPRYMSQPAVSQHLQILREAGLVTVRREGRCKIYSLNPEPLRDVFDWAKHYEESWIKKMNNLGTYLNRQERKQ